MLDEYLQRALKGEEFLVFDGAMGTMLQKRGLEPGEMPDLLCLSDPQAITGIHRAYVEAGSQVVTTNTFGANAAKLGDAASVDDVYAAAVRCAREAGAQYVAADIGPTGELLFPMGDLSFSDAYGLFAAQARAAEKAGADIIIIETMADLLEAATAVLAARCESSLPVFATMTFTETGRTFMGTVPTEAAVALDLLGVSALGVNCSVGPADLQPIVAKMLEVASCPVIVQANAGLPQVVDGATVYSLAAAEYADAVEPMIAAGASVLGGCCGTDPEYVAAVAAKAAGKRPGQPRPTREAMHARAQKIAQGDGRDAEIIAMILGAADLQACREALADEYDL